MNALRVACHDNAKQLLERCEARLLASAGVNHNILQIADVLTASNEYHTPPYWFCSVETNHSVLGCALHAAPDGLVISDLPFSAIDPLYRAIVENHLIPNRIVGSPEFSRKLAEKLGCSSGLSVKLSGSWTVGRLDEVGIIQRQQGKLRQGSSKDQELVAEWGRRYGEERPAFLAVDQFMLKKLKHGDLFFWDLNGPRTMITISGRTAHGVRLSSVYTPTEFRARGYATSAVAGLSELLLARGHQFVVLDWRSGDPVARVYGRVGFREIGTRHSYSHI